METRFLSGRGGAGVAGDYHEFINMNIHDWGTAACVSGTCPHGFYVGLSNYSLWDGVTIDGSQAGSAQYCFHIYTSNYSTKTGLTIRNSTMRNCASAAIALFATDQTLIENNIIYGGR